MLTRCAWVAVALLAGTMSAAALDEGEVRELEQACEVAREQRLKPLRDAEIARCQQEKRSDPQYCERYWSDYGNAVRSPNGQMQPRMFDDLPECVRANEARRKLNFE